MRAIVVGCGIVGISTAFFLRRAGLDVHVIDRAERPGMGTSFANGGLLHPSYCAPWNEPGIHRKLLASMGRADSPMLLRPWHLPQYVSWGTRFLANSRKERFAHNAKCNLVLALYTKDILEQLCQELALAFGHYKRGSIKIFRNETALCGALKALEASAVRLPFRVLDREALVRKEPALNDVAGELAGGIYCSADEGGDAHRYCIELASRFYSEGGCLHFGVEAKKILVKRKRVTAIRTSAGKEMTGDVYIFACAAATSKLLRPIGIHVNVMPVKGYSLTLPTHPAASPVPRTPVIDGDLHAAIVPIGDSQIRIAGTAEFSGDNLHVDSFRIKNLVALLERVFPAYARTITPASGQPWAGLRPMSTDGVPIVGRAVLDNLYVNTGHGHIGWTTGPGSGKLLSDLICSATPTIDEHLFAPDRIKGSGRERLIRRDSPRFDVSHGPS